LVRQKPLPRSDKISVTFETAPRPDARSVALAGDFNQWSPTATPMKQRKDGCWWATLRLPKGQEFAYRYVVDGREWVTDEQADRTVPNEHGETNAIVVVR
jgi:1,4-alpha-glucan branching enzyme